MGGVLAWDELFLNRLRQVATWGTDAGLVAAELPAFLLKCVLLIGLLVTARRMYQRPIRSWITHAPRFRWDHYALGLLPTVVAFSVVMAAWGALSHGAGDQPRWPVGATGAIIASLAALLLIIAINAFGEEVLCRGWLMQQTAALTQSPLIIFGLPAVVFALLHLEFYAPRMAQLIVMGLAFGWAAWRLGGLELAAGAHAGANIAFELFQPVRRMSPDTETELRALGVTTEHGEAILFQAPPLLGDWLVLTLLALLPALVSEAVYRREKRRKQSGINQGVSVSTP